MKLRKSLIGPQGIMSLVLILSTWAPETLSDATQSDDVYDSYQKRIDAIEKKQKKLDKKIKKNAKKSNKKLDDLTERVKFNGFYSFGLAKASEDISVSTFGNFEGITDDVCTDCSTILGLQMEFQITDYISAVGQFISGNATNRELQTDWGFLRFHLNSQTTFRAGRLITPFYSKSQYQMVGFATPWASLPTAYVRTARYFDGIDLKHQFSLGGLNSSVTALFGNTKAAMPGFDYELKDLAGLAFETSFGNFTTRLSFYDYITNLSDNGTLDEFTQFVNAIDSLGVGNTLLNEANTFYWTIGIEYDDGKNLVLGEYSDVRWDKGSNDGFMAYYLTYARRIGTWMPYLRYERFENHHSQRADRAIELLDNTQAGITALTTQAQQTLQQIEASDAATGQAILQVLADTIAEAVGQPEISQGVSSGVIDAHDMSQIVAGIGSSITGIQGIAAYINNDALREQNTYTLGLRKDLTSQMSVTAEYSVYTDFGDSGSFGEFSQKTDNDDIKVYRIVLDAVF